MRVMSEERNLGKNRGNAGKGRPKGVPNKTTATIKDMILKALDQKGGAAYLEQQAEENPVAFMTLLGKVLPTQMQHSGPDGGAIPISHVVRTIIDPRGV